MPEHHDHQMKHCCSQWLKYNGTQGNSVPHLQFMTQSVPPPQIVIIPGKRHDHCHGPKPECSVLPPLILHFNHWLQLYTNYSTLRLRLSFDNIHDFRLFAVYIKRNKTKTKSTRTSQTFAKVDAVDLQNSVETSLSKDRLHRW